MPIHIFQAYFFVPVEEKQGRGRRAQEEESTGKKPPITPPPSLSEEIKQRSATLYRPKYTLGLRDSKDCEDTYKLIGAKEKRDYSIYADS